MTRDLDASSLHARLHEHRVGALLADDSPRTVRFVLDLQTAAPVLPVSRPELHAQSLVLMIPDEGHDALQILVSPEQLTGDGGESVDRWHAYHGRPDHAAWVRLRIQAARLGAIVVDGSDLMRPNPFAQSQTALCRVWNAAPNTTGMTAVGVDEYGIDLRTVRGLMRRSFAEPANDEACAKAQIERLVRSECAP